MELQEQDIIEDNRAQKLARPNIIQKESDDIKICNICLGVIKEGLPTIVCDCRKAYHVSCARRLTKCPSCNAQIEDRMLVPGVKEEADVEVDYEFFSIPKLRLTDEEKLQLLEERLVLGEISEETFKELKRKFEKGLETELEYRCPSCGRPVREDATSCACGSVFSNETIENAFLCPECGSVVPQEATHCENCGVRFIESSTFQCPVCGSELDIDATECTCGAKFTDEILLGFHCPVCGEFQVENADHCDSCGVRFVDGDVFICSACGSVVSSDATMCECGAIFSDDAVYECPECGEIVEESSKVCPRCGAQFED